MDLHIWMHFRIIIRNGFAIKPCIENDFMAEVKMVTIKSFDSFIFISKHKKFRETGLFNVIINS